MSTSIHFQDESGANSLASVLINKVVSAVTLDKNATGDDFLVITFTDGSTLRVKGNYVYHGDDENFSLDSIEHQLDVMVERPE